MYAITCNYPPTQVKQMLFQIAYYLQHPKKNLFFTVFGNVLHLQIRNKD